MIIWYLLHAAHTLLRVAGLPVFPLALLTAVAPRATTATDGKRRLIVAVLKTADIAFPSHSLSKSGALGFVAVFCLPVLSLAFLGTVRRLAPRTPDFSWVDGACGDQDGPNLHGSWTQHVASYWAQRTPNTLGPPNQHDDLVAFADRSGLSAIADPEARREAAAQKADEITALLNV